MGAHHVRTKRGFFYKTVRYECSRRLTGWWVFSESSSSCHSIRVPSAVAYRGNVAWVGFEFGPISSLWMAARSIPVRSRDVCQAQALPFARPPPVRRRSIRGTGAAAVPMHAPLGSLTGLRVDLTTLRERPRAGLAAVLLRNSFDLVFGQVMSPDLLPVPAQIDSDRPRRPRLLIALFDGTDSSWSSSPLSRSN